MADKVLVTGSSGRLGRAVVAALESDGHAVTGADRKPHPDGFRERVHLADLRDEATCRRLLGGIRTIVHCAAMGWDQEPADLAAHNLEATASLVQAALAAGCSKFIYASSIQVIASEPRSFDGPPHVAYLPLDGDSPPRPTNSYAWSKLASEILVRAVLGRVGVQCVLLRFPWLSAPDGMGVVRRRLRPLHEQESPVAIEQGFSYLTFADASSLIAACLKRDLPGVRTYLPAVCTIAPKAIPDYLSRYYVGVPLRVAADELSSLIAIERITAETGWQPQTVERVCPPTPSPRASLLRRALRRLLP